MDATVHVHVLERARDARALGVEVRGLEEPEGDDLGVACPRAAGRHRGRLPGEDQVLDVLGPGDVAGGLEDLALEPLLGVDRGAFRIVELRLELAALARERGVLALEARVGALAPPLDRDLRVRDGAALHPDHAAHPAVARARLAVARDVREVALLSDGRAVGARDLVVVERARPGHGLGALARVPAEGAVLLLVVRPGQGERREEREDGDERAGHARILAWSRSSRHRLTPTRGQLRGPRGGVTRPRLLPLRLRRRDVARPRGEPRGKLRPRRR